MIFNAFNNKNPLTITKLNYSTSICIKIHKMQINKEANYKRGKILTFYVRITKHKILIIQLTKQIFTQAQDYLRKPLKYFRNI